MGKALYRQYRSGSFDEVIGQDHITTTLKNSLKSGAFAHAYLLTGPRGVGKTSVARILAHAVNDLDYDQDSTPLDIIEIDAASNRRIDEIRELRERAQISPVSAKYKVYIIDEVHMLTKEAFNALLKTLEEPPAHVIFILATTDIHKLPDTIVSRCLTFTFRPINQEDLVKQLKHIAKSENINITEEALSLLAEHGDGSFRDSISLLDHVKNIGGKIDKAEVELILGVASNDVINNIIQSLAQGDPKKLEKLLSEAYEHGASELKIAKQISSQLRTQLISKDMVLSSDQSVSLLKELLDVPSSVNPRERLELTLLSKLFENTKLETPAQPQPEVVTIEQEVPKVDEKQIVKKAPIQTVKQAEGTIKIDAELWNSVLQKLKTKNNTLYGIARMASADLQDNKLSLSFKFPFHFKQVNQTKNKSVIGMIIEELGHKNLQLEILLSENNDQKVKPKSDDKEIANINNIFGKGEVLES